MLKELFWIMVGVIVQFFPLSHTSYNLYTYSAMCISEGINRIIDLSTVDGIDKSFVINYESC